MWTIVALSALVVSASPETRPSASGSEGRRTASSTNFVVHSHVPGLHAAQLAQQCETLRAAAINKWLAEDGSSSDRWTPKCHIVVHASRASYASAVGRAAASTSGSSLIDYERGKISVRRIDLLPHAEKHELPPALAHELTHVVVADRFGSEPCPVWADEGAATLADAAEKQTRHDRDLADAFRRGHVMSLGALLSSEHYPSNGHWGAFYGQSTSLVRMLCQRRSPDQFIRFVELGRQQGYDAAVREVYGIAGIAELERIWREHAYAQARRTAGK